MVPNLLFYQLLLVAFVLICLMIHVWWPDAPSPSSQKPLKPDTPRRKRSSGELILRVIACLAEGLGIRGTARVFEIDPNTVLGW